MCFGEPPLQFSKGGLPGCSPRLKGKQWLLEVRDLWPEFAIQVGALRNRGLIGLSEWLEGFLYRHSDEIVVNSPGFVDHIQSIGAGAKEISIVPNGVELVGDRANSAEGNRESPGAAKGNGSLLRGNSWAQREIYCPLRRRARHGKRSFAAG